MKGGRLLALLAAIFLISGVIVLAQGVPPPPPPPPSQSSDSFQLTITRSGNGVVTELATGLICEPNCNLVFDSGKAITLNAKADSGFIFTGWSGACSGADSCNIKIDSDKSVNAAFTAMQAGAIEIKTQTAEEINWMLYGGIASVVVIFLIVLILLLRKKSAKLPAQQISQMAQASPEVMQLKNYIIENIKKGYSKEQLKTILVNAGYQQQLIDEAMKLV